MTPHELADALERIDTTDPAMLRTHHNTITSAAIVLRELAGNLATETATRTALRTQESRIMGILADAGVPVGDVVEGVERLTRERDRLNAEVNATLRRLQEAHEERDAAFASLDTHREVARDMIEINHELTRERDAALRWSRLWHSEARRLWREVQALSDPDQPAVEVDAEEWLAKLGGESSYDEK